MQYKLIPVDDARKIGRGIRMDAELRKTLEEMFSQLEAQAGQAVRFTLGSDEKYSTWRGMLSKYAAQRNRHIMFKKQDNEVFVAWLPNEEEWLLRPRVGRQASGFKCETCGKTMDSQRSLDAHIRMSHK